MRLKIVMEFDGSGFHGWQFQPDMITVQGEFERALLEITGNEIAVTGCGRTDAGVHAWNYVASFDYTGKISTDRLTLALNTILPRTIYVKKILQASRTFDARRDALGKIYRYTIIRGRSPLRSQTAWEYTFPLDLERMRAAAEYLIGEHDYAKLCEVEDSRDVLTVDKIEIREDRDEILIDITGRSFLYKMVRRMVGIMTECGRGKIEPWIIPDLFSRTKPMQTITAPANGLVLAKALYDKED